MKHISIIKMLALLLALCLQTATPARAKPAKSETKEEAAKGTLSADKDNADKDDKKKDKTGTDSLFPKKKTKDAKDDDSLFPKKEGEDAKTGVEIHPDLEVLFAEITEVVQLDEKGQEKLLLLQKKKAKKLEVFDAKADKRIIQLENELDRTTNEKKKAKLLHELSRISAYREKIQKQYENQAMRVLNKEQKVAWNSYELWVVISPDLEFEEDLALTDEQVAKSKAVCDQLAQKMGTKTRIAENPRMQKIAIVQIGKQVLTKDQQKAYLRQQKRKRIREKTDNTTPAGIRRGRRY